MAVLLRPKLWGSQKPPQGAAVDTGHPLAAGLIGAYIYPYGQDMRRGLPTVVPGAGTLRPSAVLGGSYDFQGSGSAHLVLSSKPILAGLRQFTVVSLVRETADTNSRAVYCERAASGNDILKLQSSFGGADEVGITLRDNAGTLINTGGGPGILNKVRQVAMTLSASPSQTLTGWVDGTVAVSAGWSGSSTFTDSIVSWVGADVADSSASFAGQIAYTYLYSRALSQSELRWLQAEPYAFMAAPVVPQRLWAVGVSAVAPARSALVAPSGAAVRSSSW